MYGQVDKNQYQSFLSYTTIQVAHSSYIYLYCKNIEYYLVRFHAHSCMDEDISHRTLKRPVTPELSIVL